MKESEHTSLGISTAFAAGVIIAEIADTASALSVTTYSRLYAALVILLAALTREYTSGYSSAARLAVILAATGCSCACAGKIAISAGWDSFTWPTLVHGTNRVKETIDSIPFSDSRVNGLIKALITADRSGLEREVKASFRAAGASHILALSGLHMGIIYSILSHTLGILGNSPAVRMFRSIVIVCTAAAFTLATGASPSLTRAFFFILAGETAGISGRSKSPVVKLCDALTLQLAITPWNIKDPGFQLSYLAMAGIIFIFPRLKGLYRSSSGYDPFRKVWEAAALSISCQITTGPAAWIHFHSFPVHFLITNIIAMPLTSLVMFFSVLCILMTMAGCCPPILVELDCRVCSILISCLKTISGM